MGAVGTLAKKELRLLARDPRAAVLLVGMPLLFILVLGLLLGEGFGQKPDNRLRVSLVDEDQGLSAEESAAWLALTPGPGAGTAMSPQALAAVTLAASHDLGRFPAGRWSDVVRRDLQETAGIKVEVIPDRDTAERLCDAGKRPAVLVFGPDFSRRVAVCSFLSEGVNPFYRDGISLKDVGAELLRDPTQPTTAAVIDQVVQVTLMRVVMPWMIGKAFEKISAEDFIERLGREVRMPVPQGTPLERGIIEAKFRQRGVEVKDGKVSLNEALKVAAKDERAEADYRRRVGEGVQAALSGQFSKYDLTGKTWATLTRSGPRDAGAGEVTTYREEGGRGLLHRGAARYQVLVPAYTVMFAFALTLVVGWLFVSERRRGTLKRLRTAPVTRAQLLVGKFLPCLALAVFQGLFLLLAGKLAFGLRWGPETWSWPQQLAALVPVVVCTALAAMGMALLVAAVARTEMQVAIYGSLLVLVLGLMSGCVFPRELMPERARLITLVTPHAWALDAYGQLMLNPQPNMMVVVLACLVLSGFGLAFLALAWHFLGTRD